MLLVKATEHEDKQSQGSKMPGEESETEDGRYPLPDYAAIDASGYDVNNKNIQPRGRGEIPMQVEAGPDPDQVVVPDDCFVCGGARQ